MGYTHYWTFKKAPRGTAAQTEKVYQKAIKECTKVIRDYSETFGGLSGYSAHSDTYGGVLVNGSERVGQCEPLVLREHFSQNEAFNFCKTGQYPYDTVVTACLIILKHRLGSCIDVTSDGRADNWNDGLILVQKVLGLKKVQIPDTIRKNEKISA
jgi:hypothetical protein